MPGYRRQSLLPSLAMLRLDGSTPPVLIKHRRSYGSLAKLHISWVTETSITYLHPSHSHQQPMQSGSGLVGPPSGPNSFQPEANTYFASPDIERTANNKVWNTDGADGGREDRALHYQPLPSLHSAAHDFTQSLERPPQYADYTNPYQSPRTSPAIENAHHSKMPHAGRSDSVASLSASFENPDPSVVRPAIQEWRTDNLDRHKILQQQETDLVTQWKQELYRQKGEARRKSIAERKASAQKKAVPSAKRRKVSPDPQRDWTPHTAPMAYWSGYGILVPTYPDVNRPVHFTPASVPPVSAHPDANGPVHFTPVLVPPVIQPPLAADDLPQPVGAEYKDYKWSVYRYDLQPTSGYEFAESWLDALLSETLRSERRERHITHLTCGFIASGTRLSLLVLHNADNTAEYHPLPTSTVSFAVYALHTNALHWTTLAYDARPLLAQCVARGLLAETQRWRADDPAILRRYHRAYWLAANRKDMNNLLNKEAPEEDSYGHIEDRSDEDTDFDFQIEEGDLRAGWEGEGVGDEEGRLAWEEMMYEAEVAEQCGPEGWQHVVLSSNSW
ncbi:hypothetical protein C7974DRAFT_428323 [Boeremia exigua]|uniref:uncharacterized protein n=1 Tax=Boeremia exigua TaxID=749465 RepID=UPI001E8D4D41|nr:uncharacterized protein C7974DRAFT_428323 [Boeremia exigua]KAH6613845.1 hypothetical protein C7974DRAFT_428323 [Boeremia exigua]